MGLVVLARAERVVAPTTTTCLPACLLESASEMLCAGHKGCLKHEARSTRFKSKG